MENLSEHINDVCEILNTASENLISGDSNKALSKIHEALVIVKDILHKKNLVESNAEFIDPMKFDPKN